MIIWKGWGILLLIIGFGTVLLMDPRRVLVDQRTGETVEVAGEHTFFFIKLQYWAPILGLFGLLALFP